MVSGSLDVKGDQVDAREGDATVLKQVVSDFSSDELIQGFHGSWSQTAAEFVDHLCVLEVFK